MVDAAPMPWLVVASAPITHIHITSHMHYRFEFAEAGASLLLVPLIDRADIPDDRRRQAMWRDLVAQPPCDANETFTSARDHLTITGTSTGAKRAPLPWWLTLLGERDGLVRLNAAPTTLVHGVWGPYALAAGASWKARVASTWIDQRPEPSRAVTGPLSAPPDELAYAGDATWELDEPMDQLLALRSWAPLLAIAPDPLQQSLIKRLPVPSARAIRAAVEHLREPVSKLPWGQWRSMWAHNGDACYDPDWYNGLAISGLARAVESGVEAIAAPARRAVAGCKRERAALIGYMSLFQDWALCSAFSDPRGWMWNADCCHNGLEGVLAESRLRQAEGDTDGAQFLRYVGARSAIGLRAALELPAWRAERSRQQVHPQACTLTTRSMTTWSLTKGITPRDEAPPLAVQGLSTVRNITWCTGATRNPYALAGTNWQWNALLRDHLSAGAKRKLTTWWQREEAGRYADWVAAYLGTDWQARAKRGDQEARIQAAVFYHLAPEVAFRLWALGERPSAIEARWATPLNLAEQLILRSGMKLTACAPGK
ncbi:MAG: hypothetical protein PF961_14805 [Planctomycetota bacterium]|nr:hypothetical protein [Planctomycetota bacterium]